MLIEKKSFPKRNKKISEIFSLSEIKNHKFFQDALKALLSNTENTKIFELSGFQVRSLERILFTEGENGTVITAGTGSGKTLGFYLPALLQIANLIDSSNWVKALAVYPRRELLKDQMLEAYKLARKLDNILISSGKRKIRIGAFFGQHR